MDNTFPTQTASAVLGAIEAAGESVHSLAQATGIPRTTLTRHLGADPGSLTVAEIARIASALGLSAPELIAERSVA